MSGRQPTLWDQQALRPVHRTAATSLGGLVYIRPRAPTQRLRVLAALRDGPLSREELAERLSLRLSAVCGRVHELLGQRLIAHYDAQPGRAGLMVERLCLTADGVDVLRGISPSRAGDEPHRATGGTRTGEGREEGLSDDTTMRG